MPQIIFKIQKAGERGRSPIEVIVKNGAKTHSQTTDNTDKLLLTLDRVLKSAKLKIESIRDIKVISHKEAGLTSQRIVKAIKQALDF
jgi:hypothetical protein